MATIDSKVADYASSAVQDRLRGLIEHRGRGTLSIPPGPPYTREDRKADFIYFVLQPLILSSGRYSNSYLPVYGQYIAQTLNQMHIDIIA